MEKDKAILIEELESKIADLEKEKASLLKVLSHDLRSPLNKLFALIGLFRMSDNALSDEQVIYLDKMELVISDGLSKMRNLMELKAIEGDGFDVLYEPLNLGKTIGRVIKEYGSAIERKNFTIVFDEKSVVIETDKLSVQRILDHLISNAIKYSPLGSKIIVKIEDKVDDVAIQVIDGGYGISEKEQESLFKKFVVSSTRVTGGESALGLGLFIAQSMAKNIGAIINYENRDGSTFILSLPKTRLA